MQIVFVFDAGALQRWRVLLVERIASLFPDFDVKVAWRSGHEPVPPSIRLLLTLERMTLWRGRETVCDPVSDQMLDHRRLTGDFTADLVIDGTYLGLSPTPAAGLILRPLFNGSPTDAAVYAALLSGQSPVISLVDSRNNAQSVAGIASLEAAEGLTGGVEAVVSRLALLLESVIRNPRLASTPFDPRPIVPPQRSVAQFAAKSLARLCVRRLYHLCCYAPHWRIGWRRIEGNGVFERGDLGGDKFTILRDPGSRFYADPFPIKWRGRTFLFFEDLDHKHGRGVISALEFDERGPIGRPTPVIDEKWHLSYPFLIEHDGALYMTPECSASGSIILYRCVEFPYRWEKLASLVDDIEAADPTIFHHEGLFWMTSCIRNNLGGYSDALAIHYAKNLLGPWRRHACFPTLVDPGSARPAGAVFHRNGALWRPVQDCSQGYGRALKIMRVERLDTQRFEQTMTALIRPGPRWPGGRLHTLNRSGDLETIDGTTYNPKSDYLRKLIAPMFDPRAMPERDSQGATA